MDMTVETLMDYFDQARKNVKKRMPERRKGGRLDLLAEAQILAPDSAVLELIPVTAANLSYGGMGLLLSQAIRMGDALAMRLPAKEGAARWVRCEAVRWQAYSNGAKLLGTKFLDMIRTDAGELPMLIDPANAAGGTSPAITALCRTLVAVEARMDPKTSPPQNAPAPDEHEHRRIRRIALAYDSAAHLIGVKKGGALRVRIQDISTGGIGFLCATPLPAGSRVGFILRFSKEKAKAVVASVVRCDRVGSGPFRIGAEFVEGQAHAPTGRTIPAQWQAASAAR
jgi:c-di-GMP-binding flagellar brake protein YcgR